MWSVPTGYTRGKTHESEISVKKESNAMYKHAVKSKVNMLKFFDAQLTLIWSKL